MDNTAVLERLSKAQEWALEQMKANQERLLEVNRRVASLVEKLPAVKMPFADRLPDQKKLVDSYFDFVTKSTKANRQFAEKLVEVWSGAEAAPAKGAPRHVAKAS